TMLHAASQPPHPPVLTPSVPGSPRSLALFFFQAEDGIRDGHVTGVQTCALPIFTMPATRSTRLSPPAPDASVPPDAPSVIRVLRSEERRVGKEWRAGR